MSPVVTYHAEDHWLDRADEPDDTHLLDAWRSGQRISAGGPLRNFDELRIHWATRTLIGREDTALTTVYDLDGLEPAYRHAINHVLEEGIRA